MAPEEAKTQPKRGGPSPASRGVHVLQAADEVDDSGAEPCELLGACIELPSEVFGVLFSAFHLLTECQYLAMARIDVAGQGFDLAIPLIELPMQARNITSQRIQIVFQLLDLAIACIQLSLLLRRETIPLVEVPLQFLHEMVLPVEVPVQHV